MIIYTNISPWMIDKLILIKISDFKSQLEESKHWRLSLLSKHKLSAQCWWALISAANCVSASWSRDCRVQTALCICCWPTNNSVAEQRWQSVDKQSLTLQAIIKANISAWMILKAN